MIAKRDIPNVVGKGEKIEAVSKENYSFTLGNATDIVVKNRNGGMTIIGLQDIEFEEGDEVVMPEEANTTDEERDIDKVKDDDDDSAVAQDEPIEEE